MNQFNNLPSEIIEFIFKKVYFNDLINLRIVDKRFKQICEQIKIKQLNIANRYNRYLFWFYTNDLTYLKEENQTMISKFLNYKSIFKLDKHLRRLSIWLNEDFNISILNEFKLLEQMEISIGELKDNYKLNLKNLKIAYFCINSGPDYDSDFKLTLDTNQLFALNLYHFNLNNFVLNYPEKILFYEINFYDDYDEIKEFINLEYLKLNGTIRFIDRDILSTFKNLKTIDLYICEFINQIVYDNLKENIISILNEKKNSKTELQIYLFGVKLNNQNQINQFKWSSNEKQFICNQLEFQLKNYDLLKDNCCSLMYKINYCDLIKLIKTIPSSFTNKFSNIHRVYANDHIDNEDQFIKFLNNLKNFSLLELINCQLNQSFYNKLINSVYLYDLKQLIIKDKEELGLNFDFILNLKELCLFETNQKIVNLIYLISKLFKENQNIQRFVFKFDTKNYILIFRKYDTNIFKINCFYLDDNSEEINNFSISNLNLDEIILKLENL